jgi:hypothetical protein
MTEWRAPDSDYELCQNCRREKREHWAVKNLADNETLICPTSIWRRMASSPLIPHTTHETDDD